MNEDAAAVIWRQTLQSRHTLSCAEVNRTAPNVDWSAVI